MVKRAALKCLGIVIEAPVNSISRHPRWFAGDAEVVCEFLQIEARQLAGGDVIVLREDPSIDQMPPENRILAVGNGSFGELHARSMAAESRAVAAKIERHFMAPGSGFEVFEIKAQQMMALNDVRIALPDFIDKLTQHFRFGILVCGNDALPPG